MGMASYSQVINEKPVCRIQFFDTLPTFEPALSHSEWLGNPRAAPLLSICRISCDTPFLKTRVALLRVPRTMVVCLARGIRRCYEVEMAGSSILLTMIVLCFSCSNTSAEFRRKLKLNDISIAEKHESQATLPNTPHAHKHKR